MKVCGACVGVWHGVLVCLYVVCEFVSGWAYVELGVRICVW